MEPLEIHQSSLLSSVDNVALYRPDSMEKPNKSLLNFYSQPFESQPQVATWLMCYDFLLSYHNDVEITERCCKL